TAGLSLVNEGDLRPYFRGRAGHAQSPGARTDHNEVIHRQILDSRSRRTARSEGSPSAQPRPSLDRSQKRMGTIHSEWMTDHCSPSFLSLVSHVEEGSHLLAWGLSIKAQRVGSAAVSRNDRAARQSTEETGPNSLPRRRLPDEAGPGHQQAGTA